ncbi:MAG: helix-turn-helix transcriptional regulator [Candidatus Acidiferrales bacterium]
MIKETSKLLTVKEFADAIGCTVSCARRWILERRIASVKVGGRLVRIPESEVERLFVDGFRAAVQGAINR